MPEFFNPFDAEKWRDLIADFDRKRDAFFDNLSALQRIRGATPDLENERKKLIKEAGPIQKNIERLMGSLEGLRGFLKGIGRTFNMGDTLSQTMGNLGAFPILLVVGIGAAAVIVNSITSWLTKANSFAQQNKLAETLAEAGATPAEIIKATNAGKQSSAKILGFDVRWVLAIGALIFIAPVAIKMIEGRR